MPAPPEGLNPDQLRSLAQDGVARLPDAVPRADVVAMAAAVWRRLRSRHGVYPDRPQTWTTPHPAQLTAKTQDLAAMASPVIRAAVDQVLGVGAWEEPASWGLPLVTLPGFAAAWDVPHKNWHLDLQASAERPRVARVFVLLADLAPGGGATAFAAGSHLGVRAAAREAGRTLRSGEARERLAAREPWFADLFSRRPGEDRRARFMAREDGPLWVGEMTGRMGDAWLMDPHMLHALTPNAAATPRIMLTQWIYGHGETASPA